MKNLILFVALISIFQIVNAQIVKNSLTKMHLKGKVKQITVNYLDNINKMDTLKPHTKDILSFDTTGNETEEDHYNQDGIITLKTIFTYNKKGENTEIIHYDGNKKVIDSSVYKYDGDDNRIESHGYYLNMNDEVYETYKYHKEGKKVEVDVYGDKNDLNKLTWKSISTYDDRGNLIEDDDYSIDHHLIGINIHTYDDGGLETKLTWYSGSKSLNQDTQKKFGDVDSQGNWLTEIVKQYSHTLVQGDSTKEFMYKRIIEYY